MFWLSPASRNRAVMGRLSEVVKTENAGSARFHLAAAWFASGRRDLAANLLPQAIPAPRAERELGGNVGSSIRDNAILLSTLLAVDPEDPRIADWSQRLAESGRRNEWRSTQDVAFSVMAIGRYLRQARSQVPYDKAELTLDGKTIATSEGGKPLVWMASSIPPRSDEKSSATALPSVPHPGTKLEIHVTGPAAARAHIAWLETGVRALPPASADSGLVIRRRYLDEHGKPLEAMRVRSGDLVQVELTLQANMPLDHVVIEDLLPAGLEIENPRLEGNGAAIVDRPRKQSHRFAISPLAEGQTFDVVRTDMRDDRMILVGRLTQSGQGTYLYTARAVTPGRYRTPSC